MKASGHHVAITGGSRGIGLGLARKFLDEGNKVLIIAHDPGRLARVAAEEPGFLTFAADLAGLDGIERVAAFVAAEFPARNVLVNNAVLRLPVFLMNLRVFRAFSFLRSDLKFRQLLFIFL